jgi:DNA-binding MarR family transcriptional regulator
VAAELGLVANTVSTLVGQLTEKRLLLRTPDQNDRRVARLTLTEPAREQVEAWRDRHAAVVARVIERLDQDERDALWAALPALGALAELLPIHKDEQPSEEAV